ncbi:MAG TPA: hypothetical protein VK907_13015 [Phnomibacter sp.]|nr:hypothetical protein [Phnomibacter sp.]
MKWILRLTLMGTVAMMVACGGSSKAKRGCPTPDSNLGAERILAGEGGKKPSKFKVKGMN